MDPGSDGLLSYGPSSIDLGRLAAAYVDKIPRGARPGALPVEQPTAKALGFAIPHSLLLRADQVFQ